jgi:hypothetical protein
VIAAVIADYRSEARSIERKAKIMGYDRGRQYRRLAHAALLEKLAKAYGLTEMQVRRIVER